MTSKIKFQILSLVVILFNIRFAASTFLKIESFGITIITIILSLLTLNYRKIPVKWLLVLFIFTGLVFISPHRIIDAWNLILMLFCLKDYPLKSFAKINLILGITTILFAKYLIYEGIVHEVYYGKAFDASYSAADLGFGNPNSTGKFIFFLIANFYILFGKHHFLTIVITLIVSIASFQYCGSRTYLFSGILMILLIIFRKSYEYKSARIVIILFVLALFFSFYQALMTINPIINMILSGRLSYVHEIVTNLTSYNMLMGYTLNETETLDNAYVSLICMGGISYFLFFLYVFINAFLRHYDFQKKFVPVTISIIASGFMESGFVAFGPANILLLWLILLKHSDKYGINNCSDLQCRKLSTAMR